MKGLLVRVGIDSTDGCWNAPMRLATGEFAYITITDTKPLRCGMARHYDEFVPVAARFGEQLPEPLLGTPTHLDPDFDQLTYGDQGQRGKRITTVLTAGDLLAFFAALRPVDGPSRPLIYALIGLYVIEEIVLAKSVPQARWGENAHTRRVPGDGDIVVRASRDFLVGCAVAFLSERCATASIVCAKTFSMLGAAWTSRTALSNAVSVCRPS